MKRIINSPSLFFILGVIVQIIIMIASPLVARAQLRGDLPLDKAFHKQRRTACRAALPPRSVAIFFSAPVRKRSNSVFYPYQQQRDFFYLTGFNEPHTLLLLFKEPQYDSIAQRSYDELLLTQARDARAELYDGKRLSPDQVPSTLGIDHAYIASAHGQLRIPWSQLQVLLPALPQPTHLPKHPYPLERIIGTVAQLLQPMNQQVCYPDQENPVPEHTPTLANIEQDNLDFLTLKTIMKTMREVKVTQEIQWLRQAIQISCQAQQEVMHTIHPGISEREVQGIHEFIYKKQGIAHTGYPSIVGAGHQGCVLHYIDNHRGALRADELILMDLGAEYNGYTADITRTIPVGGRFSKEQRAIYDLVYAAQEAVFKNCRAGAAFADNTPLALQVIHAGLVQLGILASNAPLETAKLYAPHGVTHHIGLDVHDGGNYTTMQAGMIFTVEPGIYIPSNSPCDKKWWDIAVRIEDNILIKPLEKGIEKNIEKSIEKGKGYELLSADLPRTATAIERTMAQPKSVLHDYRVPALGDK